MGAERKMVSLSGREIPYEIVRSSRARQIRLSIGPEPVVRIVVPVRRPLPAIPDLLAAHLRWISKHLDRLATVQIEPLRSGSVLPFLGVDRTLAVDVRPENPVAVDLVGNTLRVRLSASRSHLLRNVLEGWFRSQA